jgi:acyl transferase domain-containing protein
MEPIAIIGLSFKLPQGADDESELWSLLQNGRNVMTEWPKERLNIDGFFDPDGSKANKVPVACPVSEYATANVASYARGELIS